MVVPWCLRVAGLQVQRGLQQHHRALAAHGRQRAEQRSAARPQRHRPHPDLDQALRLRQYLHHQVSSFSVVNSSCRVQDKQMFKDEFLMFFFF